MIAVIDYGMGNLRSVQKALESVGAKAKITQNPSEIKKADKIVLPGVGAMKPAMEKLQALGLIDVIREIIASGKPFLGICLGLQLLFEQSDEGGIVRGLGILPGKVTRFASLKVPHMGWNQIFFRNREFPIFRGIGDGAHVYFCHSYYITPKEASVISTVTDYGGQFVSSIDKNNVFGVQFHPEKSQAVGLKLLENFKALKA